MSALDGRRVEQALVDRATELARRPEGVTVAQLCADTGAEKGRARRALQRVPNATTERLGRQGLGETTGARCALVYRVGGES